MYSNPFKSFLMGGFECSTHRDGRGRRLDLIASTRHDEFAEADYRRLLKTGMGTARDGLRWHLIEKAPSRYDFSSAKSQIAAARKTGIQVVWDFFHYGYPDDLDIFSPEFVERFADFSFAATNFLKSEFDEPLLICPVNEISFFSWVAGTAGVFYPCRRRGGGTLKRQLVRAAIASVDAIRSVSASARTVFTDPAIHVVAPQGSAAERRAAEKYRLAQFESYDMLSGRVEPELGGAPEYLDILGLNYYFHNQWRYPSRRKIPLGHDLYRPLNEILREFYYRYKRPMFLAETGIEDGERPSWFRYVWDEVALARSGGVPVQGVCLYPIVNHPGWADDRHCHNGLWDYPDADGEREIYQPLADEIKLRAGRPTRTRPVGV
jgi:beta-glucosidase/6-phospho-beta-glucosidase/beta-galactosidase